MRHVVAAGLALALGAVVLATSSLAQAPSLDDVLKRAREAVARYEQQATLLVADEQCDQKAFEASQERTNSPYSFSGQAVRTDPRGRRKWQAQVALVRTPAFASNGHPWMEFRDVVAVDGRPLPDRSNRLSSLFADPGGWSLDKARAIAAESATFGIGGMTRAVESPAMALLVLYPANSSRFSFVRTGEESVEGTRTWKIDYREQRAPALVASKEGYCPAAGTLWVDPASGDVVRASLQCTPTWSPETINTLTVTYRREPKLTLRVPFEMIERFEGPSGKSSWAGSGSAWVEGKCTYSNYRRFDAPGAMIAPK